MDTAEPRFELRFGDAGALASEYNDNLKHGRALVTSDANVEMGIDCELVLLHPKNHEELRLPARTVARLPSGPIGLEFLEFTQVAAAKLEKFVKEGGAPPNQEHKEEDDGVAVGTESARRPAGTLQKIRKLPVPQQIKLARTGTLEERVDLERRLGKSVWEGLLRNPKVTIPEVARIARKGTVPRILLDSISDNASWVRAAPVRRALLSNPRLSRDQAERILRVTPKSELKLICKGGSYAATVRDVAKKLMR